MTDKLIDWLCSWPAENRRRWAMRLLVWTVVAAVGNTIAYLVDWISVDGLILVTLVLSWLALTVTFADIVIGTDVRVKVDDGENDEG